LLLRPLRIWLSPSILLDMANHTKAPKGSSFNTDKGPFKPIGMKKAHSSGKTVPSWNAERVDKLEKMGAKGHGGIKKK